MSTEKQKKVARRLVDNIKLDKKLNGGQIVEKSGYGKTMKLYPKRVIDTPGVKDELKVLGFDEESAKKVVESIMSNEKVDPNVRLKATHQVFKVQGSYAPNKIEHSGEVKLGDYDRAKDLITRGI